MEPLLLFGNHRVSVDPKNRLMIPAQVRRCIHPEDHGSAFFLVSGQGKKAWLYPEKVYRAHLAQMPPQLLMSADMLDFYRLLLGPTHLIEMDPQGRVLVPIKDLTWTGLEPKKEFYLVGVADHLELWNIEDWERKRIVLQETAETIMAKALQAQQASSPPNSNRGA